MTDDKVDKFLEHHGIKGMRWGFLKREETGSGRRGSSKKDPQHKLSSHEKNVLHVAAKQGLTEDRMKNMYGPKDTKSKKRHELTDGQKTALKDALIIGGAGVALYGLGRLGNKLTIDKQLGEFKNSGNLRNFWKDYLTTQSLKEMTEKDIANLSTEQIHFSPGSILKRISMSNETEVRPGGFYAAFKNEDVTRYKAVLPVYWKMWGNAKTDSGYIVNLRAKADIKAPSPKETFDLFTKFLDTPHIVDGINHGKIRDLFDPNLVKRDLGLPEGKHILTPDLARKIYREATIDWHAEVNPQSTAFLKYIKDKGYNAIVDANDAQKLADTPIRILDGTLFEHAGNEILTAEHIREAQKTLLNVAHDALLGYFLEHYEASMIESRQDMIMDAETFIEHFGKKGMRWGVRNKHNQGSPSNRALNKASSKMDWDKQAKQVNAARTQLKSGKLKRDYKQAKTQYKIDKMNMGSREARKILNKKRIKINETYNKANQVKSKKGQVAVVGLMLALGTLQIASAVYANKG